MPKNRFYQVFISVIIPAMTAQAYTGKVVDENKVPLIEAEIYVLDTHFALISSVTTDSLGVYNIDSDPKITYLAVKSSGYKDHIFTPTKEDAGVIVMTPRSH